MVKKIHYSDFAGTYMSQRNDIGYNGYSRLLAGLHVRPVDETTYHRHRKIVYSHHHRQFHEMISANRLTVKKYYRDCLHTEPDEDGILSIAVSVDTTFAKRGSLFYLLILTLSMIILAILLYNR